VKFEGIYTPAITPHEADGTIDRQAFAEVLESLIAAGVHGIIIGGSTGEYYAHTMQERIDSFTYAREVIGTRLPLIVGTGAIRTEDAVTYAKAAREVGADAILVTSPPYAIPTERENAVHALTIDRAADLPIMLYNYPGRMGVSMGEEYFARVGRSRNVVAIKESSRARSTCWRGSSRTSRSAAAGTTRRWSSSPGGRGAGSAPGRTSSPGSTSPSTRPASSRRTSTRAGGS
jgi:4-hydroxy-tetrahydrodipicolinate synthase